MVNNNISLDENNVVVYSTNFEGDDLIAFQETLKILFHHECDINKNNKNDYKFRKIPFSYRITHKEKDFRELALIHPVNQLRLVKFYDDYKDSILYSCSISDFSIRKPVEIARFTFFNDKLHQTIYHLYFKF